MYFNHEKENTNIDKEFNNKKKFNFNFDFDFKKYKIPLIILGVVLLLIIIISIIFGSNRKNQYFIILEGNQNMSIYLGDAYNEPGYTAIDNKHNVLTNQVKVNGEVNTKKVGEYKITYRIKDVVKTRVVNVIEKPIGATSIYLKGLNGKIDIQLKVGQKYVEPGYVVIDTLDSNLTDRVKVNNPVNTSKPGTYRIIYSVTNSSGVTTTASRKVIVTN